MGGYRGQLGLLRVRAPLGRLARICIYIYIHIHKHMYKHVCLMWSPIYISISYIYICTHMCIYIYTRIYYICICTLEVEGVALQKGLLRLRVRH